MLNDIETRLVSTVIFDLKTVVDIFSLPIITIRTKINKNTLHEIHEQISFYAKLMSPHRILFLF